MVIVLAVLGTLLICCGVPLGFFVFYGFKGFNGAMAMAECAANVDALGKAMQGYAEKNGGKLPPVKSWQTDVAPYLVFDKVKGETDLMRFWTKEGEWSCGRNTKTGFAYNDDVAGKKLADIAAKDPLAVLVYETKTIGYNAHAPYKPQAHSESPDAIEGLVKEKRGWAVVTASGKVGFVNKNGKVSDAANFSSSKNGINIETSSSSNAE